MRYASCPQCGSEPPYCCCPQADGEPPADIPLTAHGRLPGVSRRPLFTATARVLEDGSVQIRVDDENCDEFWLTVDINREQMETLLHTIYGQRGKP